MSLLSRLFGKKCYFCGKKTAVVKRYKDYKGQTIHVCNPCLPYAHKRGIIRKS